ncbi:L-threonylcarbamoyladenylate synthase [bacterium]|jgi:L-threonylcarbamoyladenylate synthase|nr:L-threonylcarbamoyladenylate synthase [bacterium]
MTQHLNSIVEVSTALQNGQVGLFPCDTIWGIIGTLATADTIRNIKQRSKQSPFICLIPSTKHLATVSLPIATEYETELNKWWPGPVTIIAPKSPSIPNTVTAGKSSIAIRVPKFQPLNELLNQLNAPLISTSANISGTSHPLSISDISPELLDACGFIYDACEPGSNTPSTIIDCTSYPPKTLR